MGAVHVKRGSVHSHCTYSKLSSTLKSSTVVHALYLWSVVVKPEARVTGSILPLPSIFLIGPRVLRIGVACGRAVDADYTRTGLHQGNNAC